MRTLIVLTVFLMISGAAISKEKSPSSIRVLSVKSDIFYFKVEKELLNATIEVYNDSGELLATDSITHLKTIVDFYNKPPGHFVIKIKKGNVEENFDYIKKNEPQPVAEDYTEHIAITHS